MKRTEYDCIVVGAGITGLTAGITFAKETGKRVLVVEKQPVVGGMVASFRRKGFLFDTTQLIPDPKAVLDYLGVQLDLVRFDNYYARIFRVDPSTGDKKEIRIPSSLATFEAELLERYPHERKGIQRFFRSARSIYEELFHLKLNPSIWEKLKIVMACPKTVRCAGKSFAQFLSGFGITDPELLEVFDVFAAFSGLPADRSAALLTVAAMVSSLSGSYRPRGGFLSLPLAMRQRLEELGGEVATRTTVEAIVTEGGVVRGIRTGDSFIAAPIVISTVDPKVGMLRLVGEKTLSELNPAYLARVRKVKMSASSMSINLGLDGNLDLEGLGFNCGYNVVTTGGDTFPRLFNAFDAGELLQDPRCFHLAVIAPSLTTGGKQTLTIRVVPMAMGAWKLLREKDYEAYTAKKEEVAQFYIDQLEKWLIKGLKNHIVTRDIISPATFERFTGTPTGSNYDMAPYPENFGLKRLHMHTPVEGLLQPKFSHGIWPSFMGGMQAVDTILEGAVMGGYARFRAA